MLSRSSSSRLCYAHASYMHHTTTHLPALCLTCPGHSVATKGFDVRSRAVSATSWTWRWWPAVSASCWKTRNSPALLAFCSTFSTLQTRAKTHTQVNAARVRAGVSWLEYQRYRLMTAEKINNNKNCLYNRIVTALPLGPQLAQWLE